ncbi:hypothetical protein FHX42_004587 [Saccharopolyspora lacisalsi]|uniref:Uncharacterized protein n=1 Tax=Halosaccharopolyspora lacisalsi TaxID=1000566 RepID=A0A839E1Q7_9PSEU|nr:hypothetical protein [Halosaccharopolyspora lacisalsi]MBA8827203.1 hypothetical protein [Halosaccharopolyspora lacisalsi]
MDGSLDVRRFLGSQEEGSARPSGEVPVPRNGDAGGMSPEKVHCARVAVARGARDAEDCKLLLEMLGLAPDESGEPPVTH